jgi:predicted 2-oxoglutarate/Fe(II)-dependent dioxygenase YbiX
LSYEVELVYCRILKYGYNGFIAKHVDSYAEKTQQATDLSIIIQLSDPASYKGGELIIENQLMDLQPGDMLAYTYEHEHEVKRVKEGIRYVINLRCKMVK